MSGNGANVGRSLIQGFLSRLRFPQLFAVAAALFILDLLIPDLIPFVDEILLGIATALLGSWRKQRDEIDEGDRQGMSRTRGGASGHKRLGNDDTSQTAPRKTP